MNLNNKISINFELTQLNSKIYKDSELKKIIAISESKSIVKVKEYSSLQVPLKLDVNLISLGPQFYRILSRDYTMYLEIDLIIKLNESQLIKTFEKNNCKHKKLEITIE